MARRTEIARGVVRNAIAEPINYHPTTTKPPMAEATTEAEQVVRDYTEMWNDRDFERMPDLVSESFVVVNPTLPDGKAEGHEGLQEWIDAVTTGFPDFHVKTQELLASDETVMVEVRYTMTHEGEFDELPPTGREVDFQAMAKFHVEDGKVKEHRDYVDRQEFFEQLGLTDE